MFSSFLGGYGAKELFGYAVLFSFTEGSGAASKLEALFDYPLYR